MATAKSTPIALDDLDAADIERWRELTDAAAEPNPFFEPDVVLAAAATLRTPGLGLLVTREGPQWTSCMPVVRRRNWRGTPMRGTIGWTYLYCFLGTPLVRADGVDAHAEAILNATVASSGSTFLGLAQLGGDDPVGTALASAANGRAIKRTALVSEERAFLRRRDDPDGYVLLSPKRRREFRRQARTLAEHLGVELEVRDESDSTTAIEDFLMIEASGWKGRSGTAFASIGHDQFFRDICAYFRERGRLQLMVLRAGDRPLAVKCNFRAGDGLFAFKIGFDESLSRFSPGVQLELATITRFHEETALEWIDSCAAPTNQMINRLWPDRRTIETVAFTGGILGGATRRSLIAAQRARGRALARRASTAPSGRQPGVERDETSAEP